MIFQGFFSVLIKETFGARTRSLHCLQDPTILNFSKFVNFKAIIEREIKKVETDTGAESKLGKVFLLKIIMQNNVN